VHGTGVYSARVGPKGPALERFLDIKKKCVPTRGIFNLNDSELTESGFAFRTLDFDIIINYHLSQKFKLIGNDKFNHLVITLTVYSKRLIENEDERV
jgi:hypothetical protein